MPSFSVSRRSDRHNRRHEISSNGRLDVVSFRHPLANATSTSEALNKFAEGEDDGERNEEHGILVGEERTSSAMPDAPRRSGRDASEAGSLSRAMWRREGTVNGRERLARGTKSKWECA